MATFTVSPQSNPLKSGDVVCSLDSVSVCRAEADVLRQAGSITGVALAEAQPGESVQVAVSGLLAPSVTGLDATGEATLVGVRSGRARRLTVWRDDDFLLGVAGVAGGLTLRPISPLTRNLGVIAAPIRSSKAAPPAAAVTATSVAPADVSEAPSEVSSPTANAPVVTAAVASIAPSPASIAPSPASTSPAPSSAPPALKRVPTAIQLTNATIAIVDSDLQPFPSAVVFDQSGALISDAVVSWSSANKAVMTITDAGLLPIKNGTVQLSVNCDSASATVTATVAIPPVPTTLKAASDTISIASVDPKSLPQVGVFDQFGDEMTGQTVTWTSSDPSVLLIGSTGMAPQKNGTATLTARCDTASASVNVTIRVALVPTSWAITNDPISLSDTTERIFPTITVIDPFGAVLASPPIEWSSSDTATLAVGTSGFRGQKAGSTNLLVRCGDLSSRIPVQVNLPLKAVRFPGLIPGRFLGTNGSFSPFTGSYTAEAWIRPQTGIGDTIIFCLHPSYQYALCIKTNGTDKRLLLYYCGENTGPGGSRVISARNAVAFDIWSHVALVHDLASSEVRIYVNGVECARAPGMSAIPFVGATWPPEIGRRFKGDIAQVRLWNGAQTLQEIQANMRRALSTASSGRLLGSWLLDDLTGRNSATTPAGTRIAEGDLAVEAGSSLAVIDDGPNLALSGTETNPDEAVSGRATNFDGTAMRVMVGWHEDFQITGDLTIEFWIKSNAAWKSDANYHVLGKGSGREYHLTVAGGKVMLEWGTEGSITRQWFASTALPSSTWVHVAVVRSGSGQVDYFVNGSWIETGKAQPGYKVTPSLSPLTFVSPNVYEALLNAALAEVRLWNVVRTATQIKEASTRRLSGATAGLVGYWPMNEISPTTNPVTTLQDRSGFCRHGELISPIRRYTAAPALTGTEVLLSRYPAVRGYATFPAAKKGFISVPTAETLQMSGNATIEGWVRMHTIVPYYGVLMGKGDVEFAAYVHQQDALSSPQLMGMGQSGLVGCKIDYALPLDTWVHVAVVRDLTAKWIRFYLNGRLAWTYATTSASPRTSTNAVEIGGAGGVDGAFTWDLSHVRLWKVARTPQQIADNIHTAQVSGPDLVGYWPLEQLDANGKAPDLSSSKWLGSVVGSVTFSSSGGPAIT